MNQRRTGFCLLALIIWAALFTIACQPTPTPIPTVSRTPTSGPIPTTAPTEQPMPTEIPSPEDAIYLSIVWHQHQPVYYKDPGTGVYAKPWVRVHASKDYYDMAAILQDYPNVHVTFNLGPGRPVD
jgi:hypothetical protein